MAAATSFGSLLAARAVVGVFMSPFLSLIFAAVADVTPVEKRPKAIANFMMAFPKSMSFGIPVGLGLASLALGWKAPFLLIGVFGIAIGLAIFRFVPDIISPPRKASGAAGKFLRPDVIWAYVVTAIVFFTAHIIIFTATSYFRHNLGLGSDALSGIFFASGIFAIVCNFGVGRMVGRLGAVGTC